jgi:hypothetical protein
MPITMEQLPLSKVYQLLEPGPVVPLTTARKGLANVMTMSWHMMVNFEIGVGCLRRQQRQLQLFGIAIDRQVCVRRKNWPLKG